MIYLIIPALSVAMLIALWYAIARAAAWLIHIDMKPEVTALFDSIPHSTSDYSVAFPDQGHRKFAEMQDSVVIMSNEAYEKMIVLDEEYRLEVKARKQKAKPE